MARKVIITEEQYNMALGEGITLTADVAAAGGNVQRAVRTTERLVISHRSVVGRHRGWQDLYEGISSDEDV